MRKRVEITFLTVVLHTYEIPVVNLCIAELFCFKTVDVINTLVMSFLQNYLLKL